MYPCMKAKKPELHNKYSSSEKLQNQHFIIYIRAVRMVRPVFFSNFDEVQMDGTTVDEILAKCPLPGSDQNDGGGGSEGCSEHSFSSQKNLVEDISLEEVIPGSQAISPPATPSSLEELEVVLENKKCLLGDDLNIAGFLYFLYIPKNALVAPGQGIKVINIF